MTDVEPTADAAGTDGGTSFEDLEGTYDALEQTEGLSDQTLAEIKKLREEHKKFRQKFSPYAQTFGSLHEQDAQVLLGIAQQLAAGNTEAVARFFFDNGQALAGDKWNEWITPAEQAEVNETAEAAVAAGFDPAQVEQIIEQKIQQFAQQQAEERQLAEARMQIQSIMQELGYADPDAADAQLVLLRAKQLGEQDLRAGLTKAHEWAQEQLNERAKSYLATKSADAGEPVTKVGDAAAGTTPTDLSFDDKIRALVDAQLDADSA